jgi:hypothetical protein
MKKIVINGVVRNVTSQHADNLIARGRAKLFEAKEEKAAVETKELKSKTKKK